MSSAQDILKKIEDSISSESVNEEFTQKGEVIEVKDGVATVSGLEDVMFGEVVEFENGITGLVLDLLQDVVGILVLGEYSGLDQGSSVKKTGKTLVTGVGEDYLGRVVDGLGNSIDGKGEITPKEDYPVENGAAGIIERQGVDTPMETGIKAIDSMAPIGRGQRELIIGDRQTGKSTIAIDSILNQKGNGVKCIYVAIGQKDAQIRRVVKTLEEKGALDYTIIVNASADSPAVSQYIAPYLGCALGEYFMNNGQDALVVYDDLSKHAVSYREVSLLLRRPPGREAYPGDVFYAHSRLLERAARLNEEKGGGSLTALPIIETQAGDVGGYIPTNVISITDGQIFLDSDMFSGGVLPAIDVGKSVSRVGGSAQTKVMKKVAGKLRLELATYRELSAFSQFASDLDEETQNKLKRGEKMVALLKQGPYSPIPFNKQITIIYAGINGYLDDVDTDKVVDFESKLYEKLDTVYSELNNNIIQEKALTDDIESQLKTVLEEVKSELR